MGMVGGGRGAFIGGVHRMAAALDGKIDLVAGAFSSDPEKSRLSGQDLCLDPARVYASYAEMAKAEANDENLGLAGGPEGGASEAGEFGFDRLGSGAGDLLAVDEQVMVPVVFLQDEQGAVWEFRFGE